MRSTLVKLFILIRWVSCSGTSCSCNSNPGKVDFKGVHLNILGNKFGKDGFQAKVDDWVNATGATVNVVPFHPLDMHKNILGDKVNNTNHYAIYNLLPVFLPPLADKGYIMDISNETRTSRTLRWADVMQFVRESVPTYNSKTYGIPFDGDTFQLYYRRDVFENPAAFLSPNVTIPAELMGEGSQLKVPATWHEYAKIAKLFRHVDLNGDGIADFGSCVPITGFWNFYWIVAPMVSLFQHRSNSQGAFFNLNETGIEPLVDNEGFAFIMNFLYELHYEAGMGNDPSTLKLSWQGMHGNFRDGRCLMYYSWPSVASNGLTKTSSGAWAYQRGRMGVAPLPGWEIYFDRTTGKLRKCTKEACPSMGANGFPADVNAASFMANGGMTAVVNDGVPQKQKDAALDLLGYLSTNLDVTVPGPYNAFRREQLQVKPFVDSNWEPLDASMFVTTSKQTFRHPLQVLDLRVPNSHTLFGKYQKAYEDVLRNGNAGEIVGKYEKVYAEILKHGQAKTLTVERAIQSAQNELKTSIATIMEDADKTSTKDFYFENIYRQGLGLPPRVVKKIVEEVIEETDQTPIYIIVAVLIFVFIPAVGFFIHRKLKEHFKALINAVIGEVATAMLNIILCLMDISLDTIGLLNTIAKSKAEKHWRKYLTGYFCIVAVGAAIGLVGLVCDAYGIVQVLCKRTARNRKTRRLSKVEQCFQLRHIAGAQYRKSRKRLISMAIGLLQGVPMIMFLLMMQTREGTLDPVLEICLFWTFVTLGLKLAAGKEAMASFKVGVRLKYVAAKIDGEGEVGTGSFESSNFGDASAALTWAVLSGSTSGWHRDPPGNLLTGSAVVAGGVQLELEDEGKRSVDEADEPTEQKAEEKKDEHDEIDTASALVFSETVDGVIYTTV